MSPDKTAYLAQIQGVINRMASVSATCKGFSATMFAGTVAVILSVGDLNRALALVVTVIPVSIFAFYDTYYFIKELQYRDLYGDVLDDVKPADFSMTVGRIGLPLVKRAVKSKSIWLFYLVFVVCYASIAVGLAFGFIS